MCEKAFLFCSALALQPAFLRVAELIAEQHRLRGHVLAPEEYVVSPVHHPTGKLSGKEFDPSCTPLTVHFLGPRHGNVDRFGFEARGLGRLLRAIQPGWVWLHAEFWEGIVRQFLWHYRLSHSPRIVAYAAVNHMPPAAPVMRRAWPLVSRTRLAQVLLWPRLDGVAACATRSMECARRMGLPASVPVRVCYLPVQEPHSAHGEPLLLPWEGAGTFIIGFAGYLSEQKGWKVLAAAVERLPYRFKAVIVGDGPQRDELRRCLARPALTGRLFHAGAVSREKLMATYPKFSVFVLPAITTASQVEQFGCVLAEAMARGVPVIGSDSGAIPETIGEAGLVVPEADPDALAQAIAKMEADAALRRRATANGREMASRLYSCEAYARSIASLLGLREPARSRLLSARRREQLRTLYLPFLEDMPSLRCRTLAGLTQRRQKRGLREALQRLGPCTELDYRRLLRKQGLDGLAAGVQEAACLQRNLILTQVQDAKLLRASDVRALRDLLPTARWVNWNGDYRDPQTWPAEFIELMGSFDLQLAVCYDAVRALEGHGIAARYWPSAWEPDGVGHEPTWRTPRPDVLFQGNCYSGARYELVRHLRRAGTDLALYGQGWPLGWAKGNTHYDFRKGCRLVRAAKVVIGDNQWPDNDGFVSDRLFCSLAAGGAMLLHQRFTGCERLGLEDGQHLVLWNGPADLVEKLHYWLRPENEAPRKAIADAGQKFCLDRHSFDVRVRELLRMLDELDGAGLTCALQTRPCPVRT